MNRQITHKQMTFMMTFSNLHLTGKILENNLLRVVAVKWWVTYSKWTHDPHESLQWDETCIFVIIIRISRLLLSAVHRSGLMDQVSGSNFLFLFVILHMPFFFFFKSSLKTFLFSKTFFLVPLPWEICVCVCACMRALNLRNVSRMRSA